MSDNLKDTIFYAVLIIAFCTYWSIDSYNDNKTKQLQTELAIKQLEKGLK